MTMVQAELEIMTENLRGSSGLVSATSKKSFSDQQPDDFYLAGSSILGSPSLSEVSPKKSTFLSRQTRLNRAKCF